MNVMIYNENNRVVAKALILTDAFQIFIALIATGQHKYLMLKLNTGETPSEFAVYDVR